jgi:hypothetical protein
MGRWKLLPVVLLLAVLGTGCTTGTDDAATDERDTEAIATEAGDAPDDAPTAPIAAAETSLIDLPVLDERSPYVQALCSIDLFDPDEQDPMGWVIAEFRSLPTTAAEEEAEVAWMVERLEQADQLDDPLATDDLTAVAAVLRARCS